MINNFNDFFNIKHKVVSEKTFNANINKYCNNEIQEKLITEYTHQISLYHSPTFIIHQDLEVFFIWLPQKYINVFEEFKNISEQINFYISIENATAMQISLNPHSKYITFKNYCINKLIYNGMYRKFELPTTASNYKKISIDIYDLYNIYYKGNGKTFPMTLKTLDYIKKEEYKACMPLLNILFKLEIENNIIWKDIIINESEWANHLYPPIPFNFIKDKHNKKDLLEQKFKVSVPNSLNKDPFTVGYYKIKAAQLLDENERQKIYNLKIDENDFFEFYYTEKERVNKIFHIYYENKFNTKLGRFDHYYIEDYLLLAQQLKTKISLNFRTINGIKKQHDKLSEKSKFSDIPELKIPAKSKFNKLKLPAEYELITTKERLYEETLLNNNCVWSYADSINEDSCRIYSLTKDNNRYTIEIRYDNKFYIRQMLGYRNSKCPQEYIDELNVLLDQINGGFL